MLRGAILTIFSIMALSLSVFAEAQSQYSAQTSSIKNDGRFIAKLGTDQRQDVISANGLVQRLDIEIEWWGLIGQAVEIYGIRWERGNSYNLGGSTLSRSSLGKYPDLEARFDDLKPISIEVSFDVELFSEGHDDARKYDQAFNASFGPTYFRSGRASAKKTTDNFLIAESGRMMRDLSPSSPRDWQSFIDFHKPIGSGVSDANLATQNTFKAAQKIVFKNLRITKIDLPDASARAIYEEYKEREKKEKEENTEEENIWSAPKSNDVDESSAGGNIWSKDNFSKSEVANNSSNGLWDGSSNSTSENNSGSGGIWSASRNKQNKSQGSFEITKNDDGRQGVVSPSGAVLIPFRKWEVLKYREGLALVKESSREILDRQSSKSNSDCPAGKRCFVFRFEKCKIRSTNHSYWVDKNGNSVLEVENDTSTYWTKSHVGGCW